MSLDKLIGIAGCENGRSRQVAEEVTLRGWGRIGAELQNLLLRCDGFYAFESALHVYASSVAGGEELSLAEWNDEASWKSSYRGMADSCLFFAEDVFGGQFAIGGGGEEILSFDPETAKVEYLAGSLDEWAGKILDDTDYLTGYSLGHAWQAHNGQLPRGHRLLPKVPFVAGGAYDIQNMYAGDSVSGMRFRGDIATQIANLPDGAKISFKVD